MLTIKRVKRNYILYKAEYIKNGLKYVIIRRWNKLADYIFPLFYFNHFKIPKYFYFQNKRIKYFYHSYNRTWINERCLEVPLVKTYLDRSKGNILEIGNVLTHYFNLNHVILDKYEKANGVINQDIANYHPSMKYDLIISISTMEHVGFDEKKKDKEKIMEAFKNIKKLLNKGGKAIITMPFGYNPNVDEKLRNKLFPFKEIYYFKRLNRNNNWKQVNAEEAINTKYSMSPMHANAIVLGIIK